MPSTTVLLHADGVALACGLDGHLSEHDLHGLFAGDTRVLSTYRIGLGGRPWRLLGRMQHGHATAQWDFENVRVRGAAGEIPPSAVALTLWRRLSGALHDDLRIQSFHRHRLRARLTLQLDADFADIFEVHDESILPRPTVSRIPAHDRLTLSYAVAGFRRALRISFAAPTPPTFVGALVVFDLDLAPGAEWRCCVEAVPVLQDIPLAFAGDPHAAEPQPSPAVLTPRIQADPLLVRPFVCGQTDLLALAQPQDGAPPYVAAGIPWFLTLFGRDATVTALMAGLAGSWAAEGALAALTPLHASTRDDFHDMEPGKFPHELRRGELSWRRKVVQSPSYYGAHDVPALYCLALWHAWRWTGDRTLLERYLDAALAALRWCDELGDRDGDGLLEYETRTPRGYYNQGWKDAGDAVVHADGRLAPTPLALVELQGYLFAARLAVAELLDELDRRDEAERLRLAARRLRDLVEDYFWMPDARYYAFALDGNKRQVASIASNPGQLAWCGLPSPERAAAVADRLLEPDMHSGWGLRTLSAHNPAYNPLLYQLGSVWPHDTALAAAGLFRYGLRDAACALLRDILAAAAAFEGARLPELFCGFDRSHGAPVPYAKANSPQAWAAAVPILAAQLFLGLIPDAPHRRCFIAPYLPDWLPRLALHGIAIGDGRLDIAIVRRGMATEIEQLNATSVEVCQETPEAPLWGVRQRLA
ncbi:MAG: amylo-alpha-1,6-glucosidase [Ktedonobacterales bacterium]